MKMKREWFVMNHSLFWSYNWITNYASGAASSAAGASAFAFLAAFAADLAAASTIWSFRSASDWISPRVVFSIVVVAATSSFLAFLAGAFLAVASTEAPASDFSPRFTSSWIRLCDTMIRLASLLNSIIQLSQVLTRGLPPQTPTYFLSWYKK